MVSGVKPILEFDNGYTLVLLESEEAFNQEKSLLGLTGTKESVDSNYSLRNEEGNPLVLIVKYLNRSKVRIYGHRSFEFSSSLREELLTCLEYLDGLDHHNLEAIGYTEIVSSHKDPEARLNEDFANLQYYYLDSKTYLFNGNELIPKNSLSSVPSSVIEFIINHQAYSPLVFLAFLKLDLSQEKKNQIFLRACRAGDFTLARESYRYGCKLIICERAYFGQKSNTTLSSVVEGKSLEIFEFILNEAQLPLSELTSWLEDCLKYREPKFIELILTYFKGDFSSLKMRRSSLVQTLVDCFSQEINEIIIHAKAGWLEFWRDVLALAASTGSLSHFKMFYEPLVSEGNFLTKEMYKFAVEHRHHEILEFLLKVDTRPEFIQSALGAALQKGAREEIYLLLSLGSSLEAAVHEVGYLPKRGERILLSLGVCPLKLRNLARK